MTSPQNRPPVIERFYTHLDETIAQGLTPEQKEGVENAILASTLASRHQIDIRRSFPFFSKRYYLVFLFGRDFVRELKLADIAVLAEIYAASIARNQPCRECCSLFCC